MTDLAAAEQFVAANGRVLECRRFAHLFGEADPAEAAGLVVTALKAYRNPDGGIGLLDPDLRAPTSQPSSVLYALDVLVESGAPEQGRHLTQEALDWLTTVANPDGGVPFVLPTAAGWPHAPWMVPEDGDPSSLLITAGLVAAATRLGYAAHPWTAKAAGFVWDAINDVEPTNPYAFRYAIDVLDAAGDDPRAAGHLERLAAKVPADGVLRVGAGIEGETLSPLEVAPRPGHAGRRMFPDDLIARERAALRDGQQADGGWTFSWARWNPAAVCEWRAVVTIEALKTLRAYA